MEMKKLCRIFAEVLHVDEREVIQDMTLAEDLDADSLDLFQIYRNCPSLRDILLCWLL